MLHGGDGQSLSTLENQLEGDIAFVLVMGEGDHGEREQDDRGAASQRGGPRSALDEGDHAADQHGGDCTPLLERNLKRRRRARQGVVSWNDP